VTQNGIVHLPLAGEVKSDYSAQQKGIVGVSRSARRSYCWLRLGHPCAMILSDRRVAASLGLSRIVVETSDISADNNLPTQVSVLGLVECIAYTW